jgi:hypothetical protein
MCIQHSWRVDGAPTVHQGPVLEMILHTERSGNKPSDMVAMASLKNILQSDGPGNKIIMDTQ